MSLKEQVASSTLPKHVAIIMDGNGRWARKRGNMRVFGHRSAIKAVRDTTEAAAELGIENLTLYAFSTENWNRPRAEVDALMNLLVDTLAKELETLTKNDIRLSAIGHLDQLPGKCHQRLREVIDKTKHHQRMTLNLALSYGSRSSIVEAVKKIADQVANGELQTSDINEALIGQNLNTHTLPDPELLIRTSGEYRISNFLLWEIAYTELYITDKLWPDFRREDLYEALINYQKRERRFGKISEQIQKL
ncbi:MAG: isoprenyl transferase [Bacteroidota bacterium]